MSQKKMDIKEFRNRGYLQEINRQFLHPIGLALEISISETGEEFLSGILDSRDDEEGFIFDFENRTEHSRVEFILKAEEIREIQERCHSKRFEALGYVIEPISECE